MIKEALLSDFLHEAGNTRKLIAMIPDGALTYRPQPQLWSIGELASHITEVYKWYDGTFNYDVFDMSTYPYKEADISQTAHILKASR